MVITGNKLIIDGDIRTVTDKMAPQLRGLLQRSIKRDIATMVLLSCLAGSGWWFSVALPRRQKYQEFYKNYDAKAVAASMKASWEE